jgi:hypothetical protein
MAKYFISTAEDSQCAFEVLIAPGAIGPHREKQHNAGQGTLDLPVKRAKIFCLDL